MHKKSSDKFNSGNGVFFPLTFFTVIFYRVSNGIFIHADDSMIADGNSVGVFAEVINDGLCTLQGLPTVWNPVFFIADIQQLFKCIVITIFLTTSVEL